MINTKGDDSIKHYNKYYICILFALFLCIIPTSTGATITDTYLEGSGYTSGIGEGYYTTYSFYNYCPLCGAHGTLDIYVKGVNEITCLSCDADYSYSGRDKHEGYARAWLETFFPPNPIKV